MLGAIISATDPVAVVVAVQAGRRAEPRWRPLVEAESLLNDGTGVVLFAIAIAALSAARVARGGRRLVRGHGRR